ncbi:MAG: MotA/TolQ/ExbB proton channel family protein [Acidobacteriota bacterium]|nr:MAG: MotA/TolQ/ExbB proton channel family protein [Acidobacteriota bacterium]
MDLSTIIGLVLGTILVLSAIVLGENPIIFVNVQSILIVLGGTLGVTFIKNPLQRVFGTISVVKNAFFGRLTPVGELIEKLVELSRKARRESLLSLEKVEIGDSFLRNAIRLAVDGMEPAAIRTVLDTEINFLHQRHKIGQDLLEGIATSAPAFGMIGTLIGLVQMLASMDDPSKIGPAMAIAILTTLYGAVIANLFAQPLAEKLRNRSREEINARLVVLQGVLSIVEGDHPASVEQKLSAYLEPKQRKQERKQAA